MYSFQMMSGFLNPQKARIMLRLLFCDDIVFGRSGICLMSSDLIGYLHYDVLNY